MKPFTKVAYALLAGKVICPWSQSELYDVLQDETLQQRMSNWLNDIELKLACSLTGQAYYVVSAEDDALMKASARALFADIMKEFRFHVAWLELLMKVLRRDYALSPGETLRYSDVLAALNDNTSLQLELAAVPGSSKESRLQGQLDRLLARLLKDELIREANAQSRIYQFTGKLELLQDYLIFIQETEQIPLGEDEVRSESPQGELL